MNPPQSPQADTADRADTADIAYRADTADIAYRAARHGAAVLDRSAFARLVVSGRDRATYLHGLLTNDISSLTAGHGCYSAYLTAQGRMIADLWVYELGDVILLTLLAEVKDTVMAKLDQFIFSEDVQLGDVTSTFAAVAIVGPRALASVARVTGLSPDALVELPPHGSIRTAFNGHPAIVLRATDLGEPGYELLVESSELTALRDDLQAAGGVMADAGVAEVIRIEGGVPRFHQDMDEETIPLEAGIEGRAISLTKGCYVGQEVIIRVLHRGHGRVARKLVGLVLTDGPSLERGDKVQVEDREIGEVTSAALSLGLSQPIAMAYLHRDFIAPGTSVSVGGRSASVSALPFVPGPAVPSA